MRLNLHGCYNPVLLESRSHLSGLSNAVLIVFVLPQLSEIFEVKAKSLKNSSFYKVKLGLLTLTPNISECCGSTKTINMVFEGPDKWRLDPSRTGL